MPHIIKNILSVFSALMISGCTQLGLGVANLPAKLSDMEVKRNISYGSEAWQKLDLYIPQTQTNSKKPVLVFFYGGRWTDGKKELYEFVANAFAQEGYIVAIPDYSKYPKVKFPTFVEDGAAAISWVYKNIGQYDGDINNFYVSGHSSGAHIGALVTADQRYLEKHRLTPDIISAFAGLAGPYDFVPEAQDLKDMFGPPENYPQMTVTIFIDGNEAPMLLLWGENDQAVWARNHELLAKRINEKNGSVEVILYKDINHVEIIGSLTWFWKSKAPVLKDITRFFNQNREEE